MQVMAVMRPAAQHASSVHRWTNGLFKSTLHRVVNATGRERYSIAYFFEPSFDTVVECLPQCCTTDRWAGDTWVRTPGSPRADSYAEGPAYACPSMWCQGPFGGMPASVWQPGQ